MSRQQALVIEKLSYSYKKTSRPIIQELSLKVKKGSRFGLFGPNGAGKTTLMSLMTGLLPYYSGSVKLLDAEVKNNKEFIKHTIGFVPQDFSFYEELTPAENMEFFGAWYGLKKTAIKSTTQHLLKVMGLSAMANRPLKEFSGGMKRRVNLAIGVMNQPAILFLDEPTVGVDVQSRNAIISFLKEINAAGTTLVYTSHQLNEAEDLCTEIALIDGGGIITQGTLNNLLEQHQQDGLEGLFLQLTGRAYRD
ncbi:ABC transporter ATP-binding protein [Niabella ginsenosidivorans]|uniref:ABC transporter ATP-binding protein n=1 Tax=Niabella ginsenosidivorans TaxID=1176587 RepID=A0A1A9I5P3_9BACT|nr:ABC transporter ATP-binding protein [Niabella ginsenosidivorans]ANH82936.1 ABC transporter ATP-binding protein [Niabella ginsenosidivorans]